MKQGIVLSIAIAIVACSLSVLANPDSGSHPAPARPQGGQQQDAPKVVEVQKVRDNLYVLTGGGGNSTVFITDQGVVLVDTKLPGWGRPLLDKIKSLTDKPVITVINTHTHADHTSGNVDLPATVQIIAQENTKTDMQQMDLFKSPENAKFLPTKTFRDTLTLFSGKDEVDVYYFGLGGTNGDAWVVFPSAHVAASGDAFASTALPVIDVKNGGNGVALPQTLSKAVATLKDKGVDTVVTGHLTLVNMDQLKQWADFNQDFLAWTKAEMMAGKSVEDAAAEFRIPDKYAGYPMPQPMRLKGNIQAIYDELKN